MRILSHDVAQIIGAGQNRHYSIAAAQGHDRVRAHCDIASTTQMRNQASAPVILTCGFRRERYERIPVDIERDLCERQQACLFA